jgi:phosphorylase/glycogen(starch) synthase
MNGVMHFSVLDGWWVEGYKPGTGWALPMERTYENNAFQDELDVETIYNIIEDEIAPMFYHRDENGISATWMSHIKNTIADVASNFTTNRMLNDYEEKFYRKMAERYTQLVANDYAEAIAIADWKKKVSREWDHIELLSYTQPGNAANAFALGKEVEVSATLFTGALHPDDIGVELVFTEQLKNGEFKIKRTFEFALDVYNDGEATYKAKIVPEDPGMFFMAARIYARNPKLPHRQDFALVKWL